MKAFGNIDKDAIIRAAVSEGINVTQAVGTEATMNSGSTTGFAAAFDSSTGKVVVAFSDGTDGQKGKAVVGTVDSSNNSISFGSEVVFQNSEITGDQMDCVFDSSNNKIVIFYQDTNNPSTSDRTGTAIVGTVSGTSISFGTKVAFESGHTDYISAVFDSTNNRVVAFYRDEDNSRYGTAVAGTVSGTSISFGTPVAWNSANTAFINCSFDSNAGKILVVYKDVGNSNYGTAVVATVDPSDNSISFGSETNIITANGGFYETIFDSSANKHVVVYDNPNDSNHGYARVGTISGTSVSFGTEAEFENGAAEYMRGVYDTEAGKVAIVYKDGSNSNRPTFVSGTVSGTDISFDTPTVLKDVEGVTILPGVAYDSTNKRVVASYIDTTGSDNGLAQVIKTGYTAATGGTISDGSSVVVNSDGTVSSISTSSVSLGSVTQFESGGVVYIDITYDTTNDRVVIVYRDKGNSDYGTAVVGTVSGTSISFGTPVVYNSAKSGWNACAFDENAGKVGIFYEDFGSSRYGRGIVGTVDSSDNSISFGSEAGFADLQVSDIDAVYNSTAQKIVVSYKNHSNDYANAIVATISGTSISFGSSASFSGSQTMSSYTAIGYDSTNDKVVAVYNQASDYDGYAAVGTVSGTSISFGTAVKFMTGTLALPSVEFDSSNEKITIFFSDGGNSDYLEGVIGTVSGTSISFTSEQTLYDAAGVGTAMDSVYNPKSNSFILVFRGASAYGLFMPVTSSGTSLTAGSTSTITTNAIGVTEAVYDPDQEKVVAALQDGDDSDKGKAVVYNAAASNLTSENFIGFMKGAALDGTNGEILSSCSIARNQTSLTAGQTLFVSPTDGSLSETAGSPSVTAGTAISATEIIVKG